MNHCNLNLLFGRSSWVVLKWVLSNVLSPTATVHRANVRKCVRKTKRNTKKKDVGESNWEGRTPKFLEVFHAFWVFSFIFYVQQGPWLQLLEVMGTETIGNSMMLVSQSWCKGISTRDQNPHLMGWSDHDLFVILLCISPMMVESRTTEALPNRT